MKPQVIHSILKAAATGLLVGMSSAIHALGPTVYIDHLGYSGTIRDFDGVTELHQMTVSIGRYQSLPLDADCYFDASLDRPGIDNDQELVSFDMKGSQPVVHIGFPPFTVHREDSIRYQITTDHASCGGGIVHLFVNEKFSGTDVGGGPGKITSSPRPTYD